MSMAPQAIHSNLSRPHPTDSRLLQNLIKGEKSYIDNLAASSVSGYAAASALAAWGTSEAPDISKASQSLAEILASVADAQRTHVQALEGYRSALKDVLDREHSIRSVVRDRDILVGRLIKASKKKVSKKDSGLSQEEKMEKVNAAQRELHACEQVLASEEAALVGVKRRTFKEALTMRMKTMGDAGAATVEAAKEAIMLLDEFDTHGPLLQATGGGQYESMYADGGIETGAYDNQAPDQGYYAGQQNPAQGATPQMYADNYAAHGSPVAGNGANMTRDEQGRFHKDLQGTRNPQQFDGASVTPSQSASQVVDNDRSHVPLGQRYTSHFEDVEEQEGVPSDTDSEEDYRRAFIEPRSRLPAPHELGVAADTRDSFIPQGGSNGAAAPQTPRKDDERGQVPMPAVPTAPVFDVSQARGHNQDHSVDQGFTPASAQGWGSQQGGGGPYSPPRYSLSRRSGDSEGGYGHQRKSSNSLIGKMSRLFKTDIRNGSPAEGERERERAGWNTRTSGNVEQENEKRRFASLRRAEPDSSDEEPDNREVFRNVNQQRPGWDSKAGSDVGGKKLTSRILPGPKSNKIHDAEQADLDRIRASVVGGGIGSAQPKLVSGADSIRSNTTATTKTKKKKKHSVAGSEIGTAPTRPSASHTVSDLASLNSSADRPGLSRSSTTKSTSSKKKNRASFAGTGLVAGGNVFSPNAGKYGADSWIKKPASQMTAYEAVAMAGVVPKSAAPKEKPAASPTVPAATPQSLVPLPPLPAPAAAPAPAPASRPASVMSSASKNPPLKSALKTPTISRSNSTSGAKPAPSSPTKKTAAAPPATASTAPNLPVKSALRHDITQSIRAEPLPQPKMEPIPKAPAPVTSMPLPETIPASKPAPTQQTTTAAQTAAPSQPAAAKPSTSEAVAAPASAAEPADVHTTKAPESPHSIEEDKGFDGTGRLDMPDDAGEADESAETVETVTVPDSKAPMHKLDMPSSEPFSVSFDGVSGDRRGSAAQAEGAAADEVAVTQGAEQTYKAFYAQHEQSPSVEKSANGADRNVKIEPSRVYGAGGPELSDTSSEDSSPVRTFPSKQVDGGAEKAAQVQASSALADPSHKPDAGLQGLSGAAPASSTPAPALNTSALAVPKKAPSETDSAVARRKSVRLAPDTKLPPDTPDAEVATPRGTEHGDPLAARGSQLSSRIAPPPAAPAKAPKETGPVDLAAGRQSTGWTSRARDPDSSDEEADDDGYSSARKAFGSATRGWGEAMGTTKPKTKKTAGDAASVRSKTGTPKKAAPAAGSATAATPAAPQPSIGYVPTAPGSISSTMYSAKAPGSSIGLGTMGTGAIAVPSSSMYSVTAPGSVVSGNAVPPTTSTPATTATAPSASAAPASAPAAQTAAPAPLTASNLNALEGGKDRPIMPPVPTAPPVAGQPNIPTAPPPAISGKASSAGGKGGFFKRFKRNK
ncbi:Eisosome component PIL1/LSP1 [Kalmanozyma brasiliensis GHG001]|uniref:Eisosome component PIL1-domain-containing protein n=1 Tax=Kalmanozyma brasiliensis (strain GHG001) TaxID=1365824 RepID=V5GUN4_KALBG|nr:Eisosome component PIL1/LSP1 [Kalmanozyma brasiliensis GHG001]EST09602.1 Eisosome component PIL1/LSP1 [Kalmanozyma brasiliensis GHG001]